MTSIYKGLKKLKEWLKVIADELKNKDFSLGYESVLV
jgi:hypothetical protein